MTALFQFCLNLRTLLQPITSRESTKLLMYMKDSNWDQLSHWCSVYISLISIPPQYIMYWPLVKKKGVWESLFYPKCWDKAILLNWIRTQWKLSLGMVDASIGKTSSPSSSSEEHTSTAFSGQRLEPALDLQHHKNDRGLTTLECINKSTKVYGWCDEK